MGGFESIIPTAINAATSVLQQNSSQNAAQAQVDAQNQAITRQNQLLAAQQAQQDQQQQQLLAENQATARAQAGASGVGSDGGSADAILQGMAQRTASNIGYNDQTTALRMLAPKTSLLDEAGNALGWAKNGLGVFTSFYDS